MADFKPRGAPNSQPQDPYAGWDLIHRNTMTPAGVYQKGDETAYGWAWPSMVTEPAQAIARLLNTPAGTMPDPQDPQNQKDALTGLMALYGGNALKGMAGARGAARVAATLGDMEAPRAVSYSNAFDEAFNNPAMLRQMDDIKHAQLNEQARNLYGRGIDELTGSQEAQLRGWSDPALWSDTGKPNPVGAAVSGNQPFKARAYHGSDRGFDRFKEPDDGGLYSELDVPHEGVWFANDPARSEFFANKAFRMGERRGDAGSTGPAIYPADIEFKNPYFHPPEMYADEGISSLPSEFSLRELGHDGAVIDRSKWEYTPEGGLKLVSEGTDYQALQPGTVRSPLTGELLFSDTGKPNPVGAALSSNNANFKFSEKGLHVQNIGPAEITYGVNPGNKTAELTLLRVPEKERGKGAARAALDSFVKEADANGYTLTLNADPLGKGGLSKPALERFYQSAGFVRNKGKNKDFTTRAEYIRPPKLLSDTGKPNPLGAALTSDNQENSLMDLLKKYGIR